MTSISCNVYDCKWNENNQCTCSNISIERTQLKLPLTSIVAIAICQDYEEREFKS